MPNWLVGVGILVFIVVGTALISHDNNWGFLFNMIGGGFLGELHKRANTGSHTKTRGF